MWRLRMVLIAMSAMMTLDAIDRALDHPFRTFQNFGKPSVMPVTPVR